MSKTRTLIPAMALIGAVAILAMVAAQSQSPPQQVGVAGVTGGTHI